MRIILVADDAKFYNKSLLRIAYEVLGKVLFSQACVIYSVDISGRGGRQTPPPPPPRWLLPRSVRILLECILVLKIGFLFSAFYYRPRSEASEGYVFTGICLSNNGGCDFNCIMG